jgi:hypothetical protein
MPKNSPLFRSLSLLLAIAVAALSMPPAPAAAALVTTDQVLAGAAADEDRIDRERLRGLLTREEVREELRGMGVNPDEAAARVEAMSDSELASLAERIEILPAGQELRPGDPEVIAVIVILVLLLLLL